MAGAFDAAWDVVKKVDGRRCKDCGHRLGEDDFDGPQSWSYSCPECGTNYNHDTDDPYEENY